MKPHFTTPFYSVFIIFLLLAGCRQKAPAAEEKPMAASPAKQRESASFPPDAINPLRAAAGKKEGLTQRQMDSLQNITSLRKKF